MALDILKRSMELLGKGVVSNTKNYMSSLTQLQEDANIVKASVTQGYTTVRDIYRKFTTGNGPLRVVQNWFYSRSDEYSDGGDDEFDAGFDTGSPAGGDDEAASAVLNTKSMRDITRGQIGAMYQIGGKQVEASAANTAEIISSLNSRTSEITASINNMNKTLLSIDKKLEGIAGIFLAKTEREEKQMAESLTGYDGKLQFAQVWQRSLTGFKDKPAISMPLMMASLILQQGPSALGDLAAGAIFSKEFKTKSGKTISLEKILTSVNDKLETGFQTAVSALINTNIFKKIFGDIGELRGSKDYSSYRKNTYTKERAVFDGVTRTTIVDIIPGYLREITKALTGVELGITANGSLKKMTGNEFIQAATRGVYSSSPFSDKDHKDLEQRAKAAMPTVSFESGQIRAAEKDLISAYIWILYTHDRIDVTAGELMLYKDEAINDAYALMTSSFGRADRFRTQQGNIKQLFEMIIKTAVDDERTFSSTRNKFIEAIRSGVQKLHSQAMAAAQDGRLGKQAKRITKQEYNQQIVRQAQEYSPYDTSYSEAGQRERDKDNARLTELENSAGRLLGSVKAEIAQLKKKLAEDKYERAGDDETSQETLPKHGKSLIEIVRTGSQHIEDINMCILRKLHDVIKVKIVKQRPKKFFPDWYGKSDGSDDGSGEVTPPTVTPPSTEGTPTEGGTTTTGTTTETKSATEVIDDATAKAKEFASQTMTRAQEMFQKITEEFGEDSVLGKLAKIAGHSSVTEKIGSWVDKGIDKVSGAADKGVEAAGKGRGILGKVRNELSLMKEDVSDAAHGMLDKIIQKQDGTTPTEAEVAAERRSGVASRTETMRKNLAGNATISDEDKVLADAALAQLQAAMSDGDGKADMAAINKTLDKIKNRQLKEDLSNSVRNLVTQSQKGEEKPAKSKLGKILKWAFGGLSVVFAPIIKAVKSIGSIFMKGIKWLGKQFSGALKRGLGAIKDIGIGAFDKIKGKFQERTERKNAAKAISDLTGDYSEKSEVGENAKDKGDDKKKSSGKWASFKEGFFGKKEDMADRGSLSEQKTADEAAKANDTLGQILTTAQQIATNQVSAQASDTAEDAADAASDVAESAAEGAAEDAGAGGGSPWAVLAGAALKILMMVEGVKAAIGTLQKILTEALEPIGDILTDLMDALGPVLDMAKELILAVGDALKEALGIVIDIVGPILEFVSDALGELLTNILGVISPILQGVANSVKIISGILAMGLGYILKLVSGVGAMITGILKILPFGGGFANVTARIYEAIATVADTLLAYGKQNFKEGIAGIAASISDLIAAVDNYVHPQTEEVEIKTHDTTVEEYKGSAMDGLTGNGDVYNITYRNMYGSGNTTQYQYGSYMNMRDRGCGPIALADAYGRRTGGNVDAGRLASIMGGMGTYRTNAGTSVGGYMATANAMGMKLTPGGVTTASLNRATPNNPVTILGSGNGFGTRAGNAHYMNVVGSDGKGVSYVSNPLTGGVSRMNTAMLARNSVLGLYGSGDSDDVASKYHLPDAVSEAWQSLKDLASGFLSMFTGPSEADKRKEQQQKNIEEQQLRSKLGSAEYDALEEEARARFENESPRGANESATSYEKRWNDKRQAMMIALAKEKLAEKLEGDPTLNAQLIDDAEAELAEKYGSSFDDMMSELYTDMQDESHYASSGSSDGSGMYAINFTPRTEPPESGNPYYNTKSVGGYSNAITGYGPHKGLNVLNNCVGYALGRFHEAIDEPSFKYFQASRRDGGMFVQVGKDNGMDVDTTGDNPKVGDVISWTQAGKAGHVAFVEEVPDTEHIVITHSGYNDRMFWVRDKLTKSSDASNKWPIWKNSSPPYIFSGFVHNPGIIFADPPSASYLGANPTDQEVYTYLTSAKGMTGIGASGIMGCLKYESGMRSNNLEDTFNKQFGMSDEAYTKAVNDKTITRDAFIHGNNAVAYSGQTPGEAVGYGVAQFTASKLKGNLYDRTVKNGYGIDNMSGQLDSLVQDLRNRSMKGGGTLFDRINNAGTPADANKQFLWKYEAGTSFGSDADVLSHYSWMKQSDLDNRHNAATEFYRLYGNKTFGSYSQVGANSSAERDAYNNYQRQQAEAADGVIAGFQATTGSGDGLIAVNAKGETLCKAIKRGGSYTGLAWENISKSSYPYTIKFGGSEYKIGGFENTPASQKALQLIKEQETKSKSSGSSSTIVYGPEAPELIPASPSNVINWMYDNGYSDLGLPTSQWSMSRDEFISTTSQNYNKWQTKNNNRTIADWFNEQGVYNATGKQYNFNDYFKLVGSGDTSTVIPSLSTNSWSDYLYNSLGMESDTHSTPSVNNVYVSRIDDSNTRDAISALMQHTFEVKSQTIEAMLKEILGEMRSRKGNPSSPSQSPTDMFDNSRIPAQIERLTTG